MDSQQSDHEGEQQKQPEKQQRAFYRLSTHSNVVSPTSDERHSFGDPFKTRDIKQTNNGVNTTLHYPIVTEPRSRRKSSAASRKNYVASSGPESFTMTLKKKTKEFLGLEEDQNGDTELLWTERRIRLANRRYGGIDAEAIVKTLPRVKTTDSLDGPTVPNFSATFPREKPSIATYVAEGLSTLGRKVANLPPRTPRNTLSRSYLPSEHTQKINPTDESENQEIEREVFFNDRLDASEVDNKESKNVPPHPRVLGGGGNNQYERPVIGMSRIDQALFPDETDRPREYGIGAIGEVLGRDYKRSLRRNPDIQKQLNAMDDYRPYFTYWVTTVQVVVMVISLVLYGFGPVGIELNQSTGHVLSRGLFIEEVDYMEPANFWFGPRPADLIHLGAKFSPCMRRDESIVEEKALDTMKEVDSGCCIRNDNSGCVQTQRSECSTLLSTFHKWTPSNPGPDGRVSGPVCGQDPQYCTAPKSSYRDTWHDDITTWPVCHVSSVPKAHQYFGLSVSKLSPAPRHMTCETIARPCCIGIHGKCEVRTKEFCDFVNGHFHPEATLCSQVSCMEDVCGMLPFVHRHVPDQFYRLWTSLFLHAGLLHLLMTVVIQLYLMRDMEKVCGPVRIAVIYLGSGMAGNLASAIFIPYRAEAGPAGAQFGVVATLIVEVLNVWPILISPGIALGKLLAIVFIFFMLGLLPWVDNYAHIAGFFTGFLLSYALMPYIAFDRTIHSRTRRAILILLCLTSVILILAVLFVVFYYTPIYNCSWCKYLTCIPFTKDFCADQNINFRKDEPIINF